MGVKDKTELFNLNEDLSESKNLKDQYPEIYQRLLSSYNTWLGQLPEPVSGYKTWTPGVDDSKKKKKDKKKKK